jgi:hypothetical protein
LVFMASYSPSVSSHNPKVHQKSLLTLPSSSSPPLSPRTDRLTPWPSAS